MTQALGGGGAALGFESQHGPQEAGEGGGRPPGPLVLLLQHRPQPPGPQVADVTQLPCGAGLGVTIVGGHAPPPQASPTTTPTLSLPNSLCLLATPLQVWPPRPPFA